MQSKTQSLIETLVNILIGYITAIAAQVIVFPWFGIETSFDDNIKIGIIFTAVSIVRSYTIRRLFNRIHVWQARQEQRKLASKGSTGNGGYGTI